MIFYLIKTVTFKFFSELKTFFFAQGKVEDSVKLLLTKDPACSFSYSFSMYREYHQKILAAQGGAAGSVRLLLTEGLYAP